MIWEINLLHLFLILSSKLLIAQIRLKQRIECDAIGAK